MHITVRILDKISVSDSWDRTRCEWVQCRGEQ